MNRLIPAAVVLSLFACGRAPDPTDTDPTIQLAAGTSKLSLDVVGLHSSKGTVHVALFNAPDGFPGASPIIGGRLSAAANGGTLHFSYDALPAGTYAVSVIHDENDDGTLDKNIVGKPVEGYGSTNNVTHPTSSASYSESEVTVPDAQTLTAEINVHY